MKDNFYNAYVEYALRSSHEEENGEEVFLDNGKYELSESAKERMEKDCDAFRKKFEKLYSQNGWSDEQAGHDFWLTRNGHGAGFWDHNEICDNENIRDKLSDGVKTFGECNLYVGDDGLIYCE
jgi:hypothetical protein